MKPKPWYESGSLQGAAVFLAILAIWAFMLREGVAVPTEIPALAGAAFAAFVAGRAVKRSRK